MWEGFRRARARTVRKQDGAPAGSVRGRGPACESSVGKMGVAALRRENMHYSPCPAENADALRRPLCLPLELTFQFWAMETKMKQRAAGGEEPRAIDSQPSLKC